MTFRFCISSVVTLSAAIFLGGCGGSASSDSAAGSPSGGSTDTASTTAGTAAGGSASAGSAGTGSRAGMNAGGTEAGGGASVGGRSSAGGSAPSEAGSSGTASGGADSTSCPPEQWDCSANPGSCFGPMPSGDAPDGCVCDRTRPQSAADCAPSESILCLAAPGVVDMSSHIQCSCVAISKLYEVDADPDSSHVVDGCAALCVAVFPLTTDTRAFRDCEKQFAAVSCNDEKCEETPYSTDELRQQGVDCGCGYPIAP